MSLIYQVGFSMARQGPLLGGQLYESKCGAKEIFEGHGS